MCLGLWAWRWFGASAATTTQHTTPGKSLKHNITTYPHHSNTRRIPGSFSRNYIFLIISSCLSRMTDSRHKSYESTKSLETSGKLLGPDFQLVAWSSNSHSHHPTSWPQPWGSWPSSHHLAPSTPCKRLCASCWSSLLEKGTEGSTVLPRSFSCPSRCCSKRELSDLASPMQQATEGSGLAGLQLFSQEQGVLQLLLTGQLFLLPFRNHLLAGPFYNS